MDSPSSEKKRSQAADLLVYAAVRIVVCVLQAMSFHLTLRFARFLAWLAYRVDRRHRLVALDNLRQAFPGRYSEAELHALVKRVYLHFCTMLMEIVFLQRLIHKTNTKRYLNFRSEADGRRLLETILLGRPVLLVTGHF